MPEALRPIYVIWKNPESEVFRISESIETLGWLVAETQLSLRIGSNIDPITGLSTCVTIIPKDLILGEVRLKNGFRRRRRNRL